MADVITEQVIAWADDVVAAASIGAAVDAYTLGLARAVQEFVDDQMTTFRAAVVNGDPIVLH